MRPDACGVVLQRDVGVGRDREKGERRGMRRNEVRAREGSRSY